MPTELELLKEMKERGIEQIIPGTNRLIRLKTVDAQSFLRSGNMPDILTPLVVRSVYADLSDDEVRSFLGKPKESIPDAIALLDTIDFVCTKTIMDGTPLEELTLGEKRWIFRLVMSPAELLISFRYDPELDVEFVDEVEDVRDVAEQSDGS